MRPIVATIGLLAITPAAARSQTVYPNVEYIRGRDSLPGKIKGQLTIDETTITFSRKSGEEVFSIPVAHVKAVSNSLQTDPGSVGRKLLLGVFASRSEEYLYISTETSEGAEVFVFKTKKNLSPEMMARIRHNMTQPAPVTATADSTRPVEQ